METTEFQNTPDSVPKYRTTGAFIGLYLVELIIGFVLMIMFWQPFYFLDVLDARLFTYSTFLIVCIVLICLRRTRPFALGLLTAEVVFWSTLIGLLLWIFHFWNPYSMHY